MCYIGIMMLACLECRMLVIRLLRMFGMLIGNGSYAVLLLYLSASEA